MRDALRIVLRRCAIVMTVRPVARRSRASNSSGIASWMRPFGVAMRAKLGIAVELGSCHTATVGGYVIEGHVPAADIQRLLRERPKAIGLAVPGMPIGSPGMDGPEYGGRRDPYDVLLVAQGGASSVFQSH